MLNRVELIGRLASEPKQGKNTKGTESLFFILAVQMYSFMQSKVMYVPMVCYSGQIINYMDKFEIQKGDLVRVIGSLFVKDKDEKGNFVNDIKVFINEVGLLSRKRNDGETWAKNKNSKTFNKFSNKNNDDDNHNDDTPVPADAFDDLPEKAPF